MWILITTLASAAGGLLLMKLRVPGGMLVGAIVGVVILNLFTQHAYIPPGTRILAQVLTGAYIGGTINQEDIRRIPKVIGPFFVVITSFLCLNLLMAYCFYLTTDMDLLTCLFCAAPGGIGDTPLAAMDLGADGAMVSVMQFVRMLFGMGCLPTIIMLTDRKIDADTARKFDSLAHSGNRPQTKKNVSPSLMCFIPVFLIALSGGLLGKYLNVPGGILSFSTVFVVLIKMILPVAPMPMWLRRTAQVLAGCCIGSSILPVQILQIRQLVIPAIALCLGYLICCVGIGYMISKIFRIDLRESMLFLSPAGATEMALIAADLGVHSSNLVVLQMSRLLTVMGLFPQLYVLLVHIFR